MENDVIYNFRPGTCDDAKEEQKLVIEEKAQKRVEERKLNRSQNSAKITLKNIVNIQIKMCTAHGQSEGRANKK